jgi:hypothetical protein
MAEPLSPLRRYEPFEARVTLPLCPVKDKEVIALKAAVGASRRVPQVVARYVLLGSIASEACSIAPEPVPRKGRHSVRLKLTFFSGLDDQIIRLLRSTDEDTWPAVLRQLLRIGLNAAATSGSSRPAEASSRITPPDRSATATPRSAIASPPMFKTPTELSEDELLPLDNMLFNELKEFGQMSKDAEMGAKIT